MKLTAFTLAAMASLAIFTLGSLARASAYADCLTAAQDVVEWSNATKVMVCAHAQAGFADCYVAAQRVNDWPPPTRVNTCVNARRGFGACYEAAVSSVYGANLKTVINSCLTAE